MKKFNLLKLALVLCGLCLVGEGCGQNDRGPAPGDVYVDSAPPPAVVEVEPPMPGDGYIWIGGGWFWVGGAWQWQPGHWDRPPFPGARWVPNHYAVRGGRHVYGRGGWR